MTIKGRPLDNGDIKQPGPGYYIDDRQKHYETLTGSKIGKDVRKGHFLRTSGYLSPGPGKY
eukprot:CAMPEP_0170484416 /NCGR_PEP_ID=MMETSP0208-20121228/3893_1 /TAXON_ID=197538 /ORGANISM="Strombidium inclinatum, Strain S3" /LENGTH=60 /DNA_ID=CAMNT_0010757745 /DNA_START=355 /DNA_END=537 /DNA_ORIENTATION=-